MSAPILSEAEYDAITDAAAHWCMRLHADDCTDAERKVFTHWFNAHPQHAIEYEAMLEIWDISEQVAPANPAPVIELKPQTPKATPYRNRFRRHYAAAATIAALAIPLAGITGWNQGWLPNAYDTYEAQDATRVVTMADGSRVELNLGTQLVYANYKDRRSVTLKKGEAFFEVSHDSTHPFVVSAGQGSVKVTGTRFNVWMYQEQVRVTLVDGSVQVNSDRSQPGIGYPLTPGMQASYKPGDFQPKVSETHAGDTSLAWRNGKLIFNDMPLSQALPLINRYLPTPILLADNATGAIRLGGSYNTHDMSNLLASLPKVLPVFITQNQEGNPVLNKRLSATPKS